MLKYLPLPLPLLLPLLMLIACNRSPSPPLSPEKEKSTFELASGFEIELVASEPMVQDPVVIQFDEHGLLWVVEMRGFMPDIDGNGEDKPVGRVSILQDEDNDGHMDHSVIFADSLVLPRALAIVDGGALVAEEQALWYMEDLDGDFRSDRKTLVDPEYGRKGVVEHSPNGLWRGMDNWYYNAKSSYRYRRIDGQWAKDSTEFRGQWGICHDNTGRLYYNYNWSQLHVDLVPPNYLSGNPNHRPTSGIDYSASQDRRIFPIRPNPAINRGYIEGTLDEKGRLIEFTSACAPFIYRGDLFEASVVGDAFVCEPTGNLIKRNLVHENGIYPIARNAYAKQEFLASTDERFRPVWLTSGPDGALYIADMYRGIIQHGLYMSPYLRETTIKRELDQHINLGRIWRIMPENRAIPKRTMLSSANVEQLVAYLGHDNGWYRDMSQRLLVERKDTTSIELLKQSVLHHTSELARLHALWTLEGLGYQDTQFFIKALKDDNVHVQSAAIRIVEQLAAKDPAVLDRFEKALPLPDNQIIALQLALSARVMDTRARNQLLSQIITKYFDFQVFRDGVLSSIPNQEYLFLVDLLKNPGWQSPDPNKAIMIELLSTAITDKRDPRELTALLGVIDVDSLGWQHKSIITGLSFHNTASDSTKIPIEKAPEILINERHNSELNAKISRVGGLYHWPGKTSGLSDITTDTIERAAPEILAQGRNLYLSICASCHGNDGKGLPRFGPPLAASEWVLGHPERLTRILLHGMEGPLEVNGQWYDTPDILPVMPPFASTPAEDLAAVMTYIRQEWGNQASAVEARTVGGIRVRTQGKVKPWTAEELVEEYPISKTE